MLFISVQWLLVHTHSTYGWPASPLGCSNSWQAVLTRISFYTLIWIKIELQIGHGFRTLVLSLCVAVQHAVAITIFVISMGFLDWIRCKLQKRSLTDVGCNHQQLYTTTLLLYAIWIHKIAKDLQRKGKRLRKGFQLKREMCSTRRLDVRCCWLSVVSGGSGNWWHFKFE